MRKVEQQTVFCKMSEECKKVADFVYDSGRVDIAEILDSPYVLEGVLKTEGITPFLKRVERTGNKLLMNINEVVFFEKYETRRGDTYSQVKYKSIKTNADRRMATMLCNQATTETARIEEFQSGRIHLVIAEYGSV